MTKPHELLEALLDHPETQREFQQNPEAVASQFGIQLDDNTRAALLSFDWSIDSGKLLNRMNKGCLIT